MELITKLSGLLKAITYTIRVICRVNFKTVQMFENYLIKSYLVIKAMVAGWLLCSFWFCVGIEGAAKVPASVWKGHMR
jgi:hypothetical protein